MKATELLEKLKERILGLQMVSEEGWVVIDCDSAEFCLNEAIEAHKYDLVLKTGNYKDRPVEACTEVLCDLCIEDRYCVAQLEEEHKPGPGCPRYQETKNPGEAG